MKLAEPCRYEYRIFNWLSVILVLVLPLFGADGAEDDAPGWIVSCRVLEEEIVALRETAMLDSLGYESGLLWIPDWPSLGSYEGWMVYVGSFEYRDEAEQAAEF